jgi:hypothetical protein
MNSKKNVSTNSEVEKSITSKLEQLLRTVIDTRIGIYLFERSKDYNFGRSFSSNPYLKYRGINIDTQVEGMNSSISEILRSKLDKMEYIFYGNVDILRYYHPISLGEELIAVVWTDALLDQEFKQSKVNLIYILVFDPLGFIISLSLIIAIVRNLKNNISIISVGLE